MKESGYQASVFQQHRFGQQVIAEALKLVMNPRPQQYQQQGQAVAGTGPTVTNVDNDTETGDVFRTCPSSHRRPPDSGTWCMTIELPKFRRSWTWRNIFDKKRRRLERNKRLYE